MNNAADMSKVTLAVIEKKLAVSSGGINDELVSSSKCCGKSEKSLKRSKRLKMWRKQMSGGQEEPE